MPITEDEFRGLLAERSSHLPAASDRLTSVHQRIDQHRRRVRFAATSATVALVTVAVAVPTMVTWGHGGGDGIADPALTVSRHSPSTTPSASVPPSPSASRGSSAGPPPTPSHTPSRASGGATAAGSLAPFFTAVERADARIHLATAVVNAEIATGQSLTFSPAAIAAARAARPTDVAALIPAATPPNLLGPVLEIYSDLASRGHAFDRVAAQVDRAYVLAGLRNGGAAASRFAGDVATLKRLAATYPAILAVASSSRTAATLAVRIKYIDDANSGCGTAGGAVITQVPQVVWQRGTWNVGNFGPTDGSINGIGFWANYVAGTGWQVRLNAC